MPRFGQDVFPLTPATVYIIASNAPAALISAGQMAKSIYGALVQICDGTADDVEIQAAIDALPASGGTVKFSTGTFSLAAAPVLADNTKYVGDGSISTILQRTAGAALTRLIDARGGSRITLTDMTLHGNTASAMQGLDLDGAASHVTCRRVIFRKIGNAPGYRAVNCNALTNGAFGDYLKFVDCEVIDCGDGIIVAGDNITIDRCHVFAEDNADCGGSGFFITSGTKGKLLNSSVINPNTSCFDIGGLSDFVVSGGYFYVAGGIHCMNADGPGLRNGEIVGNTFEGDGTNSSSAGVTFHGGILSGATYTHTGANNASVLTDSEANFTLIGVEVGDIVNNITDGSSGTITAVTTTTITATLSGGAENDWDTGDQYGVDVITGQGSRNIDVSHNNFRNLGMAVFTDGPVSDINISDNTVDTWKNTAFRIRQGNDEGFVYGPTRVQVHDNYCNHYVSTSAGDHAGIVFAGCTRSTAYRNTFYSPATLQGCIFESDTGETVSSANNSIFDNDCSNVPIGTPIVTLTAATSIQANNKDSLTHFVNLNKLFIVPVNAGWATAGSTGTVTSTPVYMELRTNGASLTATAQTGLIGFNNNSIESRMDWSKRLHWKVTLARINSDAQCVAYVQLKLTNGVGDMADSGIGLKITNLTVIGQAYDGTLNSSSTVATLTDRRPQTFELVLDVPATRLCLYSNGVYVTNITGVPSGQSNTAAYIVISLANGGAAGDDYLYISPMEFWQEI